ncbi:MAG: ChaN family lipoprotein [Tunicatimonas sp.]
MNKLLLAIGLVAISLKPPVAQAQRPAYALYNAAGTVLHYDTALLQLSSADIILFGELHNDALVHWLALQLVKDLFARDTNLIIGAEMLETDNQLLLDEFIAGTIEERHFEQEAKLWNNYATDYAPLVSFARQHRIPVIATNVPRRYASLVAREGLSRLDSLSADAQELMAPLPLAVDLSLPGYQKMTKMMGGGASHGTMSGENMANAQALKDATMAHFILLNRGRQATFFHLNGSYHSDNFEGIYWHIKQRSPEAEIRTISCVSQQKASELEEKYLGIADIIIVVPDDMTKTY